jgi:hypothetical protein
MVSAGPNLVTEEGLAKIAGPLAILAVRAKDDESGKSCKP